MPDRPKAHDARPVRPAGVKIAAPDGFRALTDIVEVARECIVTHRIESTKRQRIRAYETTEVTRIKAAESLLRDYFEQVFDERKTNFEELFDRLDQALEQGNGEAMNAVLRGIVDIARSSPLADLGDLSQIRAALDIPDQVWDL